MTDDELIRQTLVAQGVDPSKDTTLSFDNLVSWITWGISQGRVRGVEEARKRINEARQSAKSGEPPIFCEICFERLKKMNPHSMDKAKVDLLMEIAQMNANGIEWVKIQRDGNLIPANEKHRTLQRDAVHASRLGWFDLLILKGKRDGEFKVSQMGIDFLKGKTTVPERIWCKEGHVLVKSPTQVTIHQVSGVIYDKKYWDSYPGQQSYNPPGGP